MSVKILSTGSQLYYTNKSHVKLKDFSRSQAVTFTTKVVKS